MGVVQAAQSIAIVYKGIDYMVQKDQLFDDAHPLVKGHPGLFRDVTPDIAAPVEQATKSPGEYRKQKEKS